MQLMVVVFIPFLNQAFTLSAVLRRSSPYSLYCLVAARLPSRVHLDLEMELHPGRGHDMENGISSEAGLHELCRVGVALSEEKDINRLLEMIASVARRYTNAEGCTLYLCNEEKGCLDFSVVQYERLAIYQTRPDQESDWPSVPLSLADGSENHDNVSAHCVLTREIISIQDVYSEDGFDFSGTRELDAISDYRSKSMLLCL
jgi:hypothetical protein